MVQVSYPGVYIEEVPSGNRTITGVSTSITAFVGRTLKGPSDKATRITNYGAFEKLFGGLWLESPLSYAVRQFYQNGGADAVIVRILNSNGVAGSLSLDGGTIELLESIPGTGGNSLTAEVTSSGGTQRTLTITEYATSAAGSRVVVRQESYSGANAAALNTAIKADTSLVTLSAATANFNTEPTVIPETDFTAGSAAATASAGVLGLGTDVVDIQASSNGTSGNNLAVSVYHSATDSSSFSLVLEEKSGSGYSVVGTIADTSLSSLVADVTAAALGITVVGNPSTLSNRPVAARRMLLAGGTDTTKAVLALPTTGLTLVAANEGAWGDSLRLSVGLDTANPSDTTLFNLGVELLDANGSTVASEVHRNVSVSESSHRFVKTILEQASQLVRTEGTLPTVAPAATGTNYVYLLGGQDGGAVSAQDFTGPGMESSKQGLYQLKDTDLFNLMVIPPLASSTDVPDSLWTDALVFCKSRRAMLLVDPPSSWTRPDQVTDSSTGVSSLGTAGDPNAAIYFPRIQAADPLRDNTLTTFVPSGVVAGLMARTDATRGVWKAPAGLESRLVGVRALSYSLIDGEVGQLNPLGVNCLQVRPAAGPVAWGARTMAGSDRLASEWKYVPVRRIALFIEESLYRGTQWAVFEPNDAPLWQQLRLSVGTFMNNLFRRGAFQGATPNEAYFVKCDDETTTQAEIDQGIVMVEVGFRPLKPAEFVVIRIRQMAGQVEL